MGGNASFLPARGIVERNQQTNMSHELTIAPSGHLVLLEQSSGTNTAVVYSKNIVAAFDDSASRGMLHLATNELQANLPPVLDFARSFAAHLSDAPMPDASSRNGP